MLLVLTGAGNSAANAHLSKGSFIDVTNGNVEKAPPQAQAQHQWALSSGGATQLERQGVYIQGINVFWVPR